MSIKIIWVIPSMGTHEITADSIEGACDHESRILGCDEAEVRGWAYHFSVWKRKVKG